MSVYILLETDLDHIVVNKFEWDRCLSLTWGVVVEFIPHNEEVVEVLRSEGEVLHVEVEGEVPLV